MAPKIIYMVSKLVFVASCVSENAGIADNKPHKNIIFLILYSMIIRLLADNNYFNITKPSKYTTIFEKQILFTNKDNTFLTTSQTQQPESH